MAHSARHEDAPLGFASEFERLAQRPPTETELAIAQRISDRGSVWAEALGPESLALLAVALSSGVGLRILFISPSARLLSERQIRLGTRAACAILGERPLARSGEGTSPADESVLAGLTVWSTPKELLETPIRRTFGPDGPDLVVIEDAHAASSEAFSFRPSLGRVAKLLTLWPEVRVVISSPPLALRIKKRIGTFLGIGKLSTNKGILSSLKTERFILENEQLSLRVESDKAAVIAGLVGPLARPALVLCSTPAQADAVYAELEQAQVPVHRYHAALPESERARELLHFSLPGRRAIMVAVSAFGPDEAPSTDDSGCSSPKRPSAMPKTFGLGYTRDDLRTLVHLGAPCSLAQYAQELGLLATEQRDLTEQRDVTEQANRTALLHFDPIHLILNTELLEKKRPSKYVLESILAWLLAQPSGTWFEIAGLASILSTPPRQIGIVLGYLQDAGAIQAGEKGFQVSTNVLELKQIGRQLSKAFCELTSGDPARLLEIETYATGKECRSQVLAQLLNLSKPEVSCGRCDICDPNAFALEAGIASPALVNIPGERRTPSRSLVEKTQNEESLFVLHDEAL